MNKLLFLALALLVTTSIAAQTEAKPELPKDPKAILDMARPFYDYNLDNLKPWHMKVDYQLYDDKDQPGDAGTFEYWWVSKDLNRSSWTVNGATHTTWSAMDGTRCYSKLTKNVSFLEYRIKTALLSPLPESSDYGDNKNQLELEYVKFSDIKLPCIKVLPEMTKFGSHANIPVGLFPTYCFDTSKPILLMNFSYGSLSTSMSQLVKFQEHYLPKQIDIYEGKHKLVSAKVSSIESIQPNNPALVPPADALTSTQQCVSIGAGVMAGMIQKKEFPVYPGDAKDSRISGTVVLRATIGIDGNIHELKVVSAPWPSLAASALRAVSHWRYQPYLLNGKPVEVDTTINVIYSLGG